MKLCIDEKGVYWETLSAMARHDKREHDLIHLEIRDDDGNPGWTRRMTELGETLTALEGAADAGEAMVYTASGLYRSVGTQFTTPGGRTVTRRREPYLAVAAVQKTTDNYHRERVVIVDPSQTYYISPLLQFQEAKDLHAQQAELAAMAFLSRNPKEFDQLDLLKQVFLKGALAKAQDQRLREAVEFRSKQLHQKPEIARIDILSTCENEVLATVTGQVIRAGVFQEKAFSEAFNFKLSLPMIRNPNMASNGRFPTAVGDFKYEVTK